jgi:predicted LPLAT superfamily acyltransferase
MTKSRPAWQVRRKPRRLWHIRLVAWLCRRFGWRFGAVLLWPITLVVFLQDEAARGASRRYLARVLPRRPTSRDVFRHFLTFAETLLERFFLLTGGAEGFAIRIEGQEHLARATAGGKGVVLLGAHLGSFDLLRLAAGRDAPVPIRMVMHHAAGDALAAVFARASPESAAQILPLPPAGGDGIAFALALREVLAAGGVIGVLADRPAAGQAVVPAAFLGAEAGFALGPFRLAAAMGAPLLLGFAVRLGRRRYLVRIEPFADPPAPACAREAALAPLVAAYAERLSTLCRAYPYNWFNFHDVWDDDGSDEGGVPGVSAARPYASGARRDAIFDHRADG